MDRSAGDATATGFLYSDAADLQTPVGRAINGDFLADEEGVVRRLATAARLDDATSATIQSRTRHDLDTPMMFGKINLALVIIVVVVDLQDERPCLVSWRGPWHK